MADDRNCGCGQDPCITYGVNKNPMEIGAVDTYESQTLAAAAAQARADSAANEDGRAFMWSEGRGVYKVSAYFPGKVDPQKVKTYTRLLSNPPSSNTSLKGIVSYLNKLSKKAIKDMAKTDSVDKNSRLSLMVFIRDWRIDDPTHDEFLRGVAEGHNVDEALQAGDLLNFLMVGGKELRLYDGGEYVPKTRWSEYLGPFLSKLPLGKGVEDLVGVHAKVLSLLPMKNYNHYTIAEIFADHPDLRTSLLGEPVLLAPIEFKALTALQSIVDSGSIGQFKLALSKGSSQGLRDLALSRDGNIGGVVMSAFKLASAAVSAFKNGDYKNAKELMYDLQRQYGVGAGSFASHEESLFVATLSTLAPFTANKDRVLSVKGNARQVLMAYDTTFTTDAEHKGTPAQAALAAKIVAQEGAWKYDKGAATRSGLKNAGTNGLRLFTSEHKNSGSNSGQPTKVALLSTDWLAIFYAITKCEDIVDADGTPKRIDVIPNVEKEVFENKGKLEGFDKGTKTSGQIADNKIKGYIVKNKDKDGKKYDKAGTSWKELAKDGQPGSWNKPNWDRGKVKKAYPEADHPALYKGGSSVSEYAGNEPMYRFLIYSDLQSGGGVLGNFMPQGTLTVILRATGVKANEQNFKSFEADLFYESYYTEDSLNKLLPTIEQGGERDDPVDLAGMSMSDRARRSPRRNPDGLHPVETCEHPENARGFRQTPWGVSHICERCGKELWFEDGEAWNTRSNPPTYTIRPGSTIVRRSDGKKFTYLSTIKADVGDGDTAPIYHVKDTKTNEESYLTNTSFKEDFVLDYNSEEGPSAYANPRRNPQLLPIYAGTPDNVKRNEGVIFSEVQIGRNVIKDVGEAVQSVYRGLIGGRTSIAEKRMAMAIATMQKELSDRAMEKNANAVGNLKIDYELVQGTATITIMAHADAFVIEGISDRTARTSHIPSWADVQNGISRHKQTMRTFPYYGPDRDKIHMKDPTPTTPHRGDSGGLLQTLKRLRPSDPRISEIFGVPNPDPTTLEDWAQEEANSIGVPISAMIEFDEPGYSVGDGKRAMATSIGSLYWTTDVDGPSPGELNRLYSNQEDFIWGKEVLKTFLPSGMEARRKGRKGTRKGKITFDELMAMADGSYEEKSPNDLDYYSQPRDVGSDVLEEARKAAQEVANQTGKELFLYLDFVDDDIENDFANPTFSYFLIFTSNADRFSLPEYHLPHNPPFLVKPQNPRRTASKKSSSKKPASGNMISIELTPRSQVQLSTAVDKADWVKAKMREDKSGKLKALWNEYAKGDNPKPVFTDAKGRENYEYGIITAIKWRGKNYKFSQAELKGGKNTNKKRRKMFPASLVKAMGGKGTYADYKGGQANMRMIYAKRIDNGRMVPFRINIPKILLRKRGNKVIPKDGGHKKGVKILLDTIETNFGTIDLDARFESSGGYDTYKKDRETGEFLTDKKGNKILRVPVDRGIHLLYQASGLDTEGAYSTNAYPAYSRGGKIVYRAMSFDGQPVDMEVAA